MVALWRGAVKGKSYLKSTVCLMRRRRGILNIAGYGAGGEGVWDMRVKSGV